MGAASSVHLEQTDLSKIKVLYGVEDAEECIENKLKVLALEHDPWRYKSAFEQLRLVTEEIESFCLIESGTLECIPTKMIGQISRLVVKDFECETNILRLQHNIVACDMSGTRDRTHPILLGVPWIRSLDISCCRWLPFVGLSKLVKLDMSYSEFSDVCKIDLSPLKRTLQMLTADGCGFLRLPESIGCLKELRFLSAQENLFENPVSIIEQLESIDNIEEVDMRENSFWDLLTGSEMSEYKRVAKEKLKKLNVLDNKLLNSSAVCISFSELQLDMSRTDTVADKNEDRGNCSCIEGVPCEVEYTCKDWKHRFAISNKYQN